MDKYIKLFNLLKIRPIRNIELLNQTFTHRSYLNENKKSLSSNERLEFLGDSILSFLVSEYLFNTYSELPEGELTNLRSSIVKTTTLSDVAKELQLGNYLFLSKGEEECGGRNNPSILADTLEALIGYIFLTYGIKIVQKIIEEYLISKLTQILKDKSFKDAKSIFQERVQEKYRISPVYKVLKEVGPDHAKEFTIGVFVNEKSWGSGFGRSKQDAEQHAAQTALEKWLKK